MGERSLSLPANPTFLRTRFRENSPNENPHAVPAPRQLAREHLRRPLNPAATDLRQRRIHQKENVHYCARSASLFAAAQFRVANHYLIVGERPPQLS